jgi:TldD protein
MTSATNSLLDRAGVDRDDARRHIAHGLEGADDGELFSNTASA